LTGIAGVGKIIIYEILKNRTSPDLRENISLRNERIWKFNLCKLKQKK